VDVEPSAEMRPELEGVAEGKLAKMMTSSPAVECSRLSALGTRGE
jgi:hypothetical protein